MTDTRKNPPFQSLAFTLVEEVRGRSLFRMSRQEDGTYELHVEQGSGGNPTVDFTRIVPQESAQRLKDGLQEAGVFGWEESYGSLDGFPVIRWNLNVVFKEGVFSFASHGGSDIPAGFDDMMEQYYRLDLPRKEEPSTQTQPMGAFSLPGMDFSKLSEMMPEGGMDGFALEEMQQVFTEAATNPAAFSERIRSEFRQMPPDEQNQLLDALSSTGLASRQWWENFFRGGMV